MSAAIFLLAQDKVGTVCAVCCVVEQKEVLLQLLNLGAWLVDTCNCRAPSLTSLD